MKARKKEPMAVSAPGHPAVILVGTVARGGAGGNRSFLGTQALVWWERGGDVNVTRMEAGEKEVLGAPRAPSRSASRALLLGE